MKYDDIICDNFSYEKKLKAERFNKFDGANFKILLASSMLPRLLQMELSENWFFFYQNLYLYIILSCLSVSTIVFVGL